MSLLDLYRAMEAAREELCGSNEKFDALWLDALDIVWYRLTPQECAQLDGRDEKETR